MDRSCVAIVEIFMNELVALRGWEHPDLPIHILWNYHHLWGVEESNGAITIYYYDILPNDGKNLIVIYGNGTINLSFPNLLALNEYFQYLILMLKI